MEASPEIAPLPLDGAANAADEPNVNLNARLDEGNIPEVFEKYTRLVFLEVIVAQRPL
jgi:hypothetical protein